MLMDNTQPSQLTAEQKQDVLHHSNLELEALLKELKEARKVLLRDWETLSPRERSAVSRQVKQLEERKQVLEETIEMNREF